MKTDNKVRGEFTSSIGENHIDECDMVIAFCLSEDDDGIYSQCMRLGGGINIQKTVSALGKSISRIINSIAVDRTHAILLHQLILSKIREEMEESIGERDFIKEFFEVEIK